MQPSTRTLNWPGCFNVRDLGGLRVISGRLTQFRRIVRADNLDRLTDDGFEALLDHGIQSIIDLREEVETSKYSRTPVLAKWHGVPITRTHLLRELTISQRAQLASTHDTVETYLWILKHCRAGIARTFRGLLTTCEGAKVIHCHAGRDRTGIIAALLLAVTGVSEQEIAQDYALSAPQLAAVYEQLLRRATDAATRAALRAENRSNAEDLLKVFRALRADFGSVHAYLNSTGLTSRELDEIARCLLEG